MRLTSLIIAAALCLFVGCDPQTTEERPDEPEKAAEKPTDESDPDPSAKAPETPPKLDLPNRSEPIEGLIASGQPSREQFDKLREHGYRAVINLRTEKELPGWDEGITAIRHKIGYAHIPIGGPEDLTKENVRKFHEALEQAPDDHLVLVHCGSSNRVGAMLALRARWMQEKSPEEALALGKKAGLASLTKPVEELLAR